MWTLPNSLTIEPTNFMYNFLSNILYFEVELEDVESKPVLPIAMSLMSIYSHMNTDTLSR